MNISLKNKNAIVCGSTQGIGEASAISLAKLGANITLIARNESKLLDVLKDLDKSQGQTHSFVAIDFRDSDKLKEFAKTVEVPQFDTDQDAIEKLKNKHDIEITEGKMKELSGYIEAGLTAKEIAKVMKLKFDAAMEKFLKKMGAK